MRYKNRWAKLADQAIKCISQRGLTIAEGPLGNGSPLEGEGGASLILDEAIKTSLCLTYAQAVLGLSVEENISSLIAQRSLSLPLLSLSEEVEALFEDWRSAITLTEVELITGFGLFYEALLQYSFSAEQHRSESRLVTITVSRGDSRKIRGAHFTPKIVAEEVTSQALHYLDRDLNGLGLSLDDQLQQGELRVCDPSAGAGIFLITCARQLAFRLAHRQAHRSKSRDAANLLSKRAEVEPRTLRLVIEQCLFGIELDGGAALVTTLSLWALAGGAPETLRYLERHIIVGNALTHSPLRWGIHAFDLILGNPPYISMYGRGSQAHRYSADELRLLREQMVHIDDERVVSGRLNLFLSFMVLSTRWLEGDVSLEREQKGRSGLIAFVLPDTIITNEAYTSMRQVLTKSGRLIEAQRHQSSLFQGASVGTAIIYWRSGLHLSAVNHSLKVRLSEVDDRQVSVEEGRHIIIKRPGCSWQAVSTDTLTEAALLGSHSAPLIEFAAVRDGFNTGSAERRRALITRELPPPYESRLILEGKWINPFKITPRKVWVKSAEVASAQRFDVPKIIYRQTAPHIIAAVDTEGLCYLNSAHAIIPHKGDIPLLYALCAYLNSAPFKRRYQLLTGETRRTFPQVHVSSMKAIRVPKRLFDIEDSLTSMIAELGERLSRSSSLQLDEINELDRLIDVLHQSCLG